MTDCIYKIDYMGTDPSQDTCKDNAMKITWYGHACFALESCDGIRLYTDPYDPDKAGFKPFAEAADIIIKSSSNDDFHDNDHLVPMRNGAVVVDALEVAVNAGTTTAHGIEIRAIEALEHHDHPKGHPDRNAMYRFDVDGISFGHMGDMGNDFSEAQLEFFEDIDVLLSLAGGFPVISLDVLAQVISRLRPRLVIPMHFRTLCYKPADSLFITEFLKLFDKQDVSFATRSSVTLDKGDLPNSTRALVLAYV